MSDGLHACPWPGCSARVPRHLWGCKAHWFQLPRDLRQQCNWAWQHGTFADHAEAVGAIGSWLERQAPVQESLL